MSDSKTLREILKDKTLPVRVRYACWELDEFVDVAAINKDWAIGFWGNGEVWSQYLHLYAPNWELYQEPKKKVQLYQAVYKNMERYWISAGLYKESPAEVLPCNSELVKLIPFCEVEE